MVNNEKQYQIFVLKKIPLFFIIQNVFPFSFIQQMKLHSPSEDELKKEILALEAEEAKLLRMIDQVEKERSEFREEMEKVKFESGFSSPLALFGYFFFDSFSHQKHQVNLIFLKIDFMKILIVFWLSLMSLRNEKMPF